MLLPKELEQMFVQFVQSIASCSVNGLNGVKMRPAERVRFMFRGNFCLIRHLEDDVTKVLELVCGDKPTYEELDNLWSSYLMNNMKQEDILNLARPDND